jgi:transposase
MRICGMRSGITIKVSPEDRRRLEAVVGDRNSPQKHVWRTRIVLLTADGIGTNGITRATAKSKTCVWRWQARFAEEGVDGLLRDKTRPARIPALDRAVFDRLVALTLNEAPPREATHWTGAMMAEAAGISVSSVQRIWRAHGLAPHRMRRFKLSNDPLFADRLRDVVAPSPACRSRRGRAGSMTHDYKRNGTTTLFAALNVLDGSVIGRNTSFSDGDSNGRF